jgi:hypothetical protein
VAVVRRPDIAAAVECELDGIRVAKAIASAATATPETNALFMSSS